MTLYDQKNVKAVSSSSAPSAPSCSRSVRDFQPDEAGGGAAEDLGAEGAVGAFIEQFALGDFLLTALRYALHFTTV